MHTVEMVERALELIQRLGYTVRQECLAGGGGSCELRGRKIFFFDLDFGPEEQLEQLLDTLRHEPDAMQMPMPRELHAMLVSPQ